MPPSNIKQERVDRAVEIAAYLQDEIEALKYVIEEVPYEAAPPEGHSIIELLMLIDYAQCRYYKPVVNHLIYEDKPTKLNDFTHNEKTFDPKKLEKKDIQNVLKRLASHRSSFINELKNLTIETWGESIYKDDQELLLIDFIKNMNHSDQVYLKQITNLVKAYHDEKATQRDLKQRQQRYNQET